MILFTILLSCITSVCLATQDSSCLNHGQVRSVLDIDLEWVMQGYQIGFQGFFVELLGFSSSIVKLLPHARLVKSSFKKSFNESPFVNEKIFLEQELFADEEVTIRKLSSGEQSPKFNEFPSFAGKSQVAGILCANQASFEQDYIYQGGELAKHKVNGIYSPQQCCEACVSNPLCLAWSFEPSMECSLKGRMDQSGLTMLGATSGRMFSRSAPSASAEAIVDAASSSLSAPEIKRSIPQVIRRSPVPRVVVFHGTTCIQNNQSVSMATRDINTILIGRYMLERPYLVGGYNLDEYAVMHCAARMDEIWVPTSWHKDVFTRLFAQQGSLSSMPLITVIPEAVDTNLFDPHFAAAYTEGTKRRSIVGESRLYRVDPSRLPAHQAETNPERLLVHKKCAYTEGKVSCSDNERFEFLSIFKWEYRKGWDVMLDGYWNAFKPTDDVVLRIRSYVPHTSGGDRNITRIIETYAWRQHGKVLSELAKVVWETGIEGFTVPNPHSSASKILELQDMPDSPPQPNSAEQKSVDEHTDEETEVIEPETYLTREDMRSLLASANSFVLATRGEGWGLPIAEAMAMSLPVVVTHHSGPAAFTNSQNAYLIPVLTDLDEYSFAKPDVMVLSELLRQVIVDSSVDGGLVAQEKGKRARETMKEISADSIVCKMNERLRYHASLRGWDLP